MSAAITSGTYGRQPAFTGALKQLLSVFTRDTSSSATALRFSNRGNANQRIREANDVRELARSVELQSPGFAADLYAAASRHEGLDD